MVHITTRICREKLKLKEFDSDSVVRKDLRSAENITEEEFYQAAVELLALIYRSDRAGS